MSNQENTAQPKMRELREFVSSYSFEKGHLLPALLDLQKKYTNQYLTITGTKTVKSYNLMNFFSDYFQIPQKKIMYLKNKGHYDNKPTPFKLRNGKNFYLRNTENFKASLIKLANE